MAEGVAPNGENRGIVPEIVPANRQKLQVGQWAIPLEPGGVVAIKVGSILALLGFAGWRLQNFFQLRGVVDLLASRIDLGFLWALLLSRSPTA